MAYRSSVGLTANGDLVVLLHGQPGTGREWHRVVEALSGVVTVVAPDRPGYGRNPLPAGGVPANVDWLTGLVDGCGRPAVLVAHSWAGGVALAFALRRPDLARGLVLVGSVGPGGITRADRFLARAAKLRTMPVVGAAVRRMGNGSARREGPGPRAALARRSTWARRAVHGFLVEQAALLTDMPAVVAQLEEITAPTVVLSGTRDRIVRLDTAKALAARLPNAELISVPGGHLLHRTHPGLVAGVVRRLLAESSRT